MFGSPPDFNGVINRGGSHGFHSSQEFGTTCVDFTQHSRDANDNRGGIGQLRGKGGESAAVGEAAYPSEGASRDA